MKSLYFCCINLFFTASLYSCNSSNELNEDSQTVNDTIRVEQASDLVISPIPNEISDDSIQISLDISEISSNSIELVISLELFGESWFVSPLEADYKYGMTTILFEENDNLELIEPIEENPKSTDRYNEDGTAFKVISGNAMLKQKLKILKQENFKVNGSMTFLLEPVCAPLQFEFQIIQNSGKMSVNTPHPIVSDYK